MRKRLAFTMMEMIFVIVVLGIVVGGTFIQISGVYEDMMQKQHSSELQTEAKVVVEQVTSRLSSSIKDSLVAMDTLAGADCKGVSALVAGDDNSILAWVGRSDESNLGLWYDPTPADTTNNDADYKPGWSGFVDVSVSDASTISTNGSKLSDAQTIVNQITGLANTLSTNPITAIYFAGSGTNTNACSDFFGNYATLSKMYKVQIGSINQDINMTRVDKNFANISEQYALSHSAYAIERTSNGELYLYSFRPWLGEKASDYGVDADVKRYILGKNVTGFGFKWEGGLFRVNICVGRTLNGFPIEVCKEKAVF